MFLGALIDSGVSAKEINDVIGSLGLSGVEISSEIAERGGVNGTRVSVQVDPENHTPQRIEDFIELTMESDLPESVIKRSCAVFQRLADAEIKVHKGSDYHVGELGDVDTLVDVVGSVYGLEALGVSRFYSSPIPSGSGLVNSKHGLLPVPAPATSILCAMVNAPVIAPPIGMVDVGEMVTPTGAAIITTLASFMQPTLNIESVGYGLGQRESPHYPNVLALWVGEEKDAPNATNLTLLETNIDDMSAELLGYVQERLFDLGALDVWFTPIQMKKNRPATMLSALVMSSQESLATDLVLRETTSLGVRVRPVTRHEAQRQVVNFESSFGTVSVKIKSIEGSKVSVAPEYDHCRQLAVQLGLPLIEVYRAIQEEATTQLIP